MKTYLPVIGWVFSAWIAFGINPAPAQDAGGYFGAQYAMFTYSESDVTFSDPLFGQVTGSVPDYDLSGIILRGGYKVNPNFAVEGRFAIPMGDDTQTATYTDSAGNFLGSVQVTTELDSLFGVYALGIIPVNQAVNLYGALGWTDIGAKYSAPGVSSSESDSGISYGFGVEANFDVASLTVEYMQYYDDTTEGVDVTFDALSVGFVMPF